MFNDFSKWVEWDNNTGIYYETWTVENEPGSLTFNILFYNFIMCVLCISILHKQYNIQEQNKCNFLRKEGNVLFNNALDTFYFWLYGIRHMVKDHTDSKTGNLCCHMGYSFVLYVLSHRQDSTYHSCGKLAGMRNSCIHSNFPN